MFWLTGDLTAVWTVQMVVELGQSARRNYLTTFLVAFGMQKEKNRMANHKAWPDEGEMVRMTIYLPKRLRDKLRAKSDPTGTSVSRELTKLILKVDRYL